MNTKEKDARVIIEQLQKLPEDIQERISYIIQGALLMQQK